MGGDCIGSDLVILSTGYDFLKMVIDVACGQAPDLRPAGKSVSKAEIRFLFSEEDVRALEKIKAENPASIYRTSAIDLSNLGKIKDSATRLGYYILTN